jgi:hypothetical protein
VREMVLKVAPGADGDDRIRRDAVEMKGEDALSEESMTNVPTRDHA